MTGQISWYGMPECWNAGMPEWPGKQGIRMPVQWNAAPVKPENTNIY